GGSQSRVVMLRSALLRAAVLSGLSKGAALRIPSVSLASAPPFILQTPRGEHQRHGHFCTSTSAPRQPEEEQEERFGEHSSDFSSRTSFRRASPEQRELNYVGSSEEPEEQKTRSFRSRTGRRNTQYWYFLQCKKLIRENKLAEALQLFEGDMLRGERLQPEEFNYSVLIGGCGRVGYVKKAFQLYNSMKKRGLEPSDATYTALFNACAMSPWKRSGLEQALKLRQELRRKNVPLSGITHHALLKAMALAGDLKACFQVLRDMLQSGQAVTQETFQYLLMSCVEDKQQGFRLALQVWHQMLSIGMKPDLQNYNILLRAARDCGIGDPAVASALLLRGQEETSARRRGQRSKVREGTPRSTPLDVDIFESRLLALPADTGTPDAHSNAQSQFRTDTSDLTQEEGLARNARRPHTEVTTSDLTTQTHLLPLSAASELPAGPAASQNSRLPNLLDPVSCRSDVVALGTVSSTSDRLALMGDLEGFLGKMQNDGLKPTIKTITLLADVMQPGEPSVRSLISVAAESGVKLDVAFFNTLIRKAAKAGDLEGAKAVKVLMAERRLPVNAQTFCGIALACGRQGDGLQLLSDMEACGIEPNAHVFSALISQASRRLDYAYLHELLRQMHRLQVPPNEVIIRQLEFAAQYPPNYNQFKSKNTYLEKIDGFRGFYREWLEFMPGQETPHPWDKYHLPKAEAEQDGDGSQNQSTDSRNHSSDSIRTDPDETLNQ
ncbi:hypothetical protein NFI96_026636, partial [Prochilodus magdalenae]